MLNSNDPGNSVPWDDGPVVLGCGNVGGIGGVRDFVGSGMGDEASFASMDEAVERGISRFDTAERDGAGASEQIVGRWFESRCLGVGLVMACDDVAGITTAPSRTPPHLELIGAASVLEVGSEEAAEWASWFLDARR